MRHKINEEIKAREVLVIDSEGENRGLLPIREAIKLAKLDGLDLVEVSPNDEVPVCKLCDYGRLQYETSKKKSSASKAKRMQTKEIKFRPVTGLNDLKVKAKNALKSLDKGDSVKVVVFFKGRENSHPEVGFEAIENFLRLMRGKASFESAPTKQGNQIVAVLCKNEDLQTIQ